MEKTKAPKTTPSPQKTIKSKEVHKGKSPTTVFISMALDMTWKLAAVVLIPIIAGNELTKRFNNGSYLIGGILIAFFMSGVVIYQSYINANNQEIKKGSK